jgi:dipeptidyl aminopeptidase/acylaminoacyl peptidase
VRRLLLSTLVAAATLAAPASASAAELVGVGDDRLWLVSDDGATRSPLAAPREHNVVAWSPDGERIAFSSVRRDEFRLFTGPPQGPFTEVPGSERMVHPAWSPDGAMLAAARPTGGSYAADIVLLPAAGGAPAVVTTGSNDGRPAWSPDGTQLAFTRYGKGPGSFNDAPLMAVRTDGSGLRTLSSDGYDAEWSPDGQRVVFSSRRDQNGVTCEGESDDCEDNHELYVIGADGTGERRLTDDSANDVEPSWSPDGTRIAFASNRHWPTSHELFVMDADGGCVTQLTIGSFSVRHPAWRPGRLPVGRGACGVRVAPYEDSVDLAGVRLRDAVPLFPGRQFGGMRLVGAAGRYLDYDECVEEPCAGGISIETYTTCGRNPARSPLATDRVLRIRGAVAVLYNKERLEVLSGGTTTVILTQNPSLRLLKRVAAALRPVARPDARPGRLARPQLPVEAWKRLLSSPRVRRDGIEHKRDLVRSDRRVLRALVAAKAGRRPACAERPRA